MNLDSPVRRRAMSLLVALVAAPLAAITPAVHAQSERPREISWDDLVPPNWNPLDSFKDLIGPDAQALKDGDPRAQKLMERMRKVWDAAPTVASMEGRAVKLPGYVVPLEQGEDGMTEFLLVPYFGACIHTPPPPANQIVHVRSSKPVKGLRTMDAVWAIGTMTLDRNKSDMGASGYTLSASKIDKYTEKSGRNGGGNSR